jgi:hypothetical protein
VFSCVLSRTKTLHCPQRIQPKALVDRAGSPLAAAPSILALDTDRQEAHR